MAKRSYLTVSTFIRQEKSGFFFKESYPILFIHCLFIYLLNLLGVTLVNIIMCVSGVQFCNISGDGKSLPVPAQ